MNEKKYTRLNRALIKMFFCLLKWTVVVFIICKSFTFEKKDEDEDIIPKAIPIEQLEPGQNFNLEEKKEQLKQFENTPLQSGAKSNVKKHVDNLSRKKVKEVGYGITEGEIALAKSFGLLPKNAKLPSSLTKAQADKWFEEITIPAYTMCVEKLIGNRPITPEQKFALVSFTHNLGSGCTKKLLCHADEDIASEMVRYVYSNHVRRGGLVKRRAWEASLWESGLEKPTVIASR